MWVVHMCGSVSHLCMWEDKCVTHLCGSGVHICTYKLQKVTCFSGFCHWSLKFMLTWSEARQSRKVIQFVCLFNRWLELFVVEFIYTVFARSDAAATIYFNSSRGAATVRERPLLIIRLFSQQFLKF